MDRTESFRQSLEHALQIDLPVAHGNATEINEHRVAVTAFDQQWSNTATGFNLQQGLSGQAFTTAFMVAVSDGTRCAVYADGNHLYTCSEDDALQGALTLRSLPSQREAIKMFGSIFHNGSTHTADTLAQQDADTRREEEEFLQRLIAKDRMRK